MGSRRQGHPTQAGRRSGNPTLKDVSLAPGPREAVLDISPTWHQTPERLDHLGRHGSSGQGFRDEAGPVGSCRASWTPRSCPSWSGLSGAAWWLISEPSSLSPGYGMGFYEPLSLPAC